MAVNMNETDTMEKVVTKNFYEDVIAGLRSSPKHLSSKYFYDAKGDLLFQQIMQCPEYYLTKYELEIFSKQTRDLANSIF